MSDSRPSEKSALPAKGAYPLLPKLLRFADLEEKIGQQGWNNRTIAELMEKWEVSQATVYKVRAQWVELMQLGGGAAAVGDDERREAFIADLVALAHAAQADKQFNAARSTLALVAKIRGWLVERHHHTIRVDDGGLSLAERFKAIPEPDEEQVIDAEFTEIDDAEQV